MRQIEKSLKAGGLKDNKETIRNYMKVEVKWRSWKRRKAPLLTEAKKKKTVVVCSGAQTLEIGRLV